MKRLAMFIAAIASLVSLLVGSSGVATAAKPSPPPSTGFSGTLGPDSSCVDNFWTIFREGGPEDAYAVIASSTVLSKKQLRAAAPTVVPMGDQDSVNVAAGDLDLGESTFLYITPLLGGEAIGKQTLHSFTC